MRGELRRPEVGRMASLGTFTCCNTRSLVSDARRLSLPFWSFAEKPLVSVGTRKARIDSTSSIAPVLAQTTATCAVDPLVIHILAPFRVQPSLVSFATVIMPAGLEP